MGRERVKYHKAKMLAEEGLSINYVDSHHNFNSRSTAGRQGYSNSGNSPQRGKPQNFKRGSKMQDAIQKEIQFLSKGKNVNSSGDLIVPVHRIPEHVKRNKYFNPKNYILPEKYSALRKMAETNVARRFEERHKKASNTRKYRRKVENKQRRTNIMIEPRRDHYS